MRKFLEKIGIFRDEEGAVTVDWVVITAVIVTLGVLVTTGIRTALMNESADIALSIDQLT